MARKITLTIDGDTVHITEPGQRALGKIHERIHPDYTRTTHIAAETVTVQGLARSRLLTFREKWATIEVTLTPRGIQAVTELHARGLLPGPK